MNLRNSRCLSSVCVVVGLAGIAAVSGCAKKTVVGKWSGTLPGPGKMSLPGTVEFKDDGTANLVVSAMGATATATGTYKYEDDTLTETLTSMTVAGQTRNMTETMSAKVVLDGDSMTLTSATTGKSYTVKRETK